jgi:murein DD-endopeptidase MepM/ murein hydrolase activator NlpD
MGNVKTLTSSVTSLKKELSGVYDVLKKIKGLGPSAFGDVNAVLSKSGQFGNGQGTPVFAKTPVNGAPKFSSQTPMAAAKPGSNAQQSQYEKTAVAMQTQYLDMGIRQAKFGMAAGVVAATGAVVSGVAGMLPATGQVAQRAGIFYGASAMFGGTNRIANQKTTFSAMRGGITSDMGDAEAFSALTSFSFMPGSKNMAQGLGDVSAAAKALGMDNANAAAAVGAMSTGSMGAQLYQYGIRQYDDKGNLRKSGDISKDILQRVFYPGQDVSKIGAEQFAKDSMGMNLDYQLSTMGITGDFLTKTKAEMGLAVTGKNPNLESVDTSGSPLKSFLDIQTSETKLVQKHEKDILIGAQKAADALKILNEKLEKTPSLIVQLNSALTTFLATKSGGGVKDLVTGVAGGVASTIMASKALTALKNLKAGGAPVTQAATKEAAKQAAKTAATNAARTAATQTAVTVAGTSAAATAGVTAAVTLPVAGMVYGQYQYNKKGQENLTQLEKLVAAQANGWKNPDGTPFSTGPKETFMSAAPKKSWWQKTKDFFTTGLTGHDPNGPTGVQGGPTSGFSSDVSGDAPSVNAFTFSSGAKPMARGAVASSMSATSISKVVGAGFGAKDPSLTMAGALNYHTGQDTPMEVGTPVHARFAGKVVERNLSRDLGIAVEVDHGDGYSSIYGHLNLKSVRAGQDVKVGDLIGKSGATGRVRGPHLHFELRKGKVPTDPKGYAAGNPGGGADSGATGGASKVILGTGSEKEWAAGLLGKLGAPVTDSSVNALTTWMRHEGGHWKNSAHYNPLNTTLNVSNNESMNSVGVKRYKSWDEGYAATVGTLTGKSADARGYTAIVNALKSGASTSDILAAINNSAWMTGKTGKNPYKFQGGPTDGFNTNVPSATPGTGMSSTTSGNTTSSQSQTNNIYVTLQIQQANQQEAEAFAKTLKKYLEKDNKLQKIGSN